MKIKGLDELDFAEKSSSGQMKKSSTPLTKIKGSRKHQCPECDKYFLTSPILKEHLLSHKNKTTGVENISEVSKETKNSENIYLNTVVIQELGKEINYDIKYEDDIDRRIDPNVDSNLMKLQENGENISDNVNPDFNTDHTEQHRETKPDIQRNNGLVTEEGNTIQVYSSEKRWKRIIVMNVVNIS